MRSPALLSLLIVCGWATHAEGRLFWQTYGSVVPTAEGCAWNTNSDYFVPRHCDTCRYGLFSPCKSACTTSPACRRCHALYQGYCSPYGCCHYCRRNQVYARKCGCCPVAYCGPYRPCCRPHLCQRSCCPTCPCSGGMCLNGMCPADGCVNGEDCQCLANVESTEFQILGSISLSGDPLLTSLQLGSPGAGMPLLPGQVLPEQVPSIPQEPTNPKIPVDPQTPLDGNPAAIEYLPQPGT